MTNTIKVRGAKTHNLKNISVDLPRNKLVVITGLSGSGKSSLAFDTLYAEGNRRYVESLSVYARQFLSMMDKADVDSIEGLSPAISIEQKTTSHNPRSTVGTITEIYDYLRLLFARVGTPHCPRHGHALEAKSVDRMVEDLFIQCVGTQISIKAPLVQNAKGSHQQLFDEMRIKGFGTVLVNNDSHSLQEPPTLDKKLKHTIELVIDTITINDKNRRRLTDSLETAIRISKGTITIATEEARDPILYSTHYSCPECDFSIQELEPRLFSFNNPIGACSSCDGLGHRTSADPDKLIIHPNLSLRDGAITGWGKQNPFSFSLLESLAEHYEFSVDTPIKKLSKRIHAIIFHGNNRERIPFYYTGSRNQRITRRHSFEGIAVALERRYRETESADVRDELMRYFSTSVCTTCNGSRLCPAASHVRINSYTMPDLTDLSIEEALHTVKKLGLSGNKLTIADPIKREIVERLTFLNNVGLRYLSLNRNSNTLSGGETQRIRLASQIGAGLMGVLYVLDEPSIGLHQRDNLRLLDTLTKLRDIGNTVLVVEHDKDAILNADYVVDLGLGAGVQGGEVLVAGPPKKVIASKNSLTGRYLRGELKIPVPKKRRPVGKTLTLENAHGNNLKNITAHFPVGCFTCISGVSGSGKSTLINNTLYPLVAHHLHRSESNPKNCDGIKNLDLFDKVICINQSPIGRTPRSNPATYVGLFTLIRDCFSRTPEARARGYNPGRFSFNVKGGRCEECQGDGVKKVEMNFLADVYVTCELCEGRRFNRETLAVTYKGKSIYDVLVMTIAEAAEFFKHHPQIYRKLRTLLDVGLDYLTLGQSATTLSGGEATRIKLSKELSKRNTGKTLYLLDEPTVGLHFHDIAKLVDLLLQLREQGGTLIVIEHNLDIIKVADYVIDLGPEGGKEGGYIVAEGTPEDIASSKKSETGKHLKEYL